MPFTRCRRSAAQTVAVALATVGLAACTPKFGLMPTQPWVQVQDKDGNVVDSPWSGPTVQVLVNHITCQLIRDYKKHRKDEAWQRLAEYHFVAAVSLNLSVTNNENFNPSFGWVTPLTAAGHVIQPVITNPTSTQSVTSSTYNKTVTVGFQLSGNQTNNPTLTYQIDMQRIALAALSDEDIIGENLQHMWKSKDAGEIQEAAWEYKLGKSVGNTYNSTNTWCDQNQGENGFRSALKGDLLQGDLAIDYNINNGLHTLDAVSLYNVYGSSGPATLADVGPDYGASLEDFTPTQVADVMANLPSQRAPPQPPSKQGGALAIEMKQLVSSLGSLGLGGAGPAGPGAAGAAGAAGSAGGATSSFGAAVTFNVVAGLNGGENWTLLQYKGPSGGGGGGGPSGGSGGGSGGGGQPLSVTRTATDILTITYAPTCKTNERFTLSSLKVKSEHDNALSLSFYVEPTGSVVDDLHKRGYLPEFKGSVSIPKASGTTLDSLTSTSTQSNQGQSNLVFLSAKNEKTKTFVSYGAGTVAWSYYQRDDGATYYRGVVSPIEGGAQIGVILIKAAANPKRKRETLWDGDVSDDVISKLPGGTPTASYWNTVPGCDVTTAPQVQQVVNAAAQKSDTLTTQSIQARAAGQ
jgi:hypothetical protein